jgi:hypothetical protein
VFDPEDTVRFYALLLGGVGMIKSSPEQLIQKGTDWTYLNQLKAEMPAPAGAAGLTKALYCEVTPERTLGAGRSRPAE